MKCSWLYRHTFFAGFCTFSWSQQVLFWINWCGANIASFCASFVGFTIIFEWKNTFGVCGIMKNCIFFTNSIEFIYSINASMSTFPTLFDFFSFDNSLAWICKRQIKILYLRYLHVVCKRCVNLKCAKNVHKFYTGRKKIYTKICTFLCTFLCT